MSRAARIIALWEAGAGARAERLPACLLRGDRSTIDVDRLPLGHRDAALLRLRMDLFGSNMPTSASCPACDALVEFDADLEAILAVGSAADDSRTVAIDGRDWRVRAPSAEDLRAVASIAEPEAAERALAGRCLEADDRLPHLDAEALRSIEEAIEAQDPLAAISFSLACPDCGHAWEAGLEPASLLWSEVTADAARLFEDVVLLARTYGWSERDILALSPARRRIYREFAAP